MTHNDPEPCTEIEQVSDSPVDIFRRTDPRSMVNLVSPNLASAFFAASEKVPHLMGLDEKTLYKTLREDRAAPTPTDNRIRIKFWMEYDRATAENSKINIQNVLAGVATDVFFYRNYLPNAKKVAWLLCPPSHYTAKMEEILDFGLDRLREYLELDPVGPGGKVNVKLMEMQAKIVVMAEQRLKGAVTQRLETKSMSLNISTTDKQVAKAAMLGSMEEIDARLEELKKRDKMEAAKLIENQVVSSGSTDES